MKIYYSPDERSGGSHSPVASGDHANGSTSDNGVSGQNGSGGGSQSGDAAGAMIPKSRFDQAVKKEREQRTQLEQQLAKATNDNRAWQQWHQSQQAMQSTNESDPKAQNGQGGGGLDEKYVRGLFANDEQYTAMEEYFSYKLGQGQGMTPEQVNSIVERRVNAAVGKINTGFNVANDFSEMEKLGMINQDEAQDLQGQLNTYLAGNPQVSEDPNNVTFVVDRLYRQHQMNKLRNGETVQINPNPPDPINPMQPVVGGASRQVVDVMPADQIRMGRLKGLSPERLKELRDRSVERYDKATNG